jgi:hypothetical protein
MDGFAAEGIWPAGDAIRDHVTVVTGIDHGALVSGIHYPAMALAAHRSGNNLPVQPTLDQVLADAIQGTAPFRTLTLSSATFNDLNQQNISFRGPGEPDTAVRSPSQLFDMLFAGGGASTGDPAAQARRARQQSVLDGVLEQADRLEARVGAADKQRLDQYFTAVRELEQQLGAQPAGATCTTPSEPPQSGRGSAAQGGAAGNWHEQTKSFVDLTVLALACDLTNVATIQYSDCWSVHYDGYTLGTGIESLGNWSDHFLSHKLGDRDRATDLDGLPASEAMRIANVRVVAASRFKVRRFAYLVGKLAETTTPTGTLLDETLAMFVSEHGDGDGHGYSDMPVLLAGHAGGFETGRCVAARGQRDGALHASILQRFGMDVDQYGDPAGSPIAGL